MPVRCSSKSPELFILEGDHGIDFHGAAGGNVAGGQRDKDKQCCNADHGHWIVGMDFVEHRTKITGHAKRHGDAHKCSYKSRNSSLPHDEAQQVFRLGAKRHTDAYFRRAPHNFVGKQAVEADAGKSERKFARERTFPVSSTSRCKDHRSGKLIAGVKIRGGMYTLLAFSEEKDDFSPWQSFCRNIGRDSAVIPPEKRATFAAAHSCVDEGFNETHSDYMDGVRIGARPDDMDGRR